MATTMQALMSRFARNPAVYRIPIPVPKANEILVKVAYVSLNPTDYKHATFALPPSKVIGCEFSGHVTDSQTSSFKKGDRVAGVVHGCKDSTNGGFAEYVVADPSMCFLVPAKVELREACTLTVGWVSSLQALQQRLFADESLKSEKADSHDRKDAVLIYSAASNCGMHALQFGRIKYPETYRIAIASTQHHDRLKALGADICFDYKSPTLKQDVQALNKDIVKAYDCHSEGTSTVDCANLLGRAGSNTPTGRVIRTLPPRIMKGTLPEGVKVDWHLAYTSMGKDFRFFFIHYPASEEDHRLASESLKSLTGLLESGQVTPVRSRIVDGGLDTGVLNGFEEMKAGKVRGEKLVVEVEAGEK